MIMRIQIKIKFYTIENQMDDDIDSIIGRVYMGTFIVGTILVIIVGLIIRNMIKAKKAGKSIQCGCDCNHCGGGCKH